MRVNSQRLEPIVWAFSYGQSRLSFGGIFLYSVQTRS